MTTKKQVLVLIDGYNLYHGIDDLEQDHLKWVNIEKLTNVYIDENVHTVIGIKYFTSYATWRQEEYKRHRKYVRALSTTKVEIILGRFKKKNIKCKICEKEFSKHEEKETDVNIAVHMIDAAHSDEVDYIILISGDTDLSPAIKFIKGNYPEKIIKIIAPPRRANSEMRRIGDRFIEIKTFHLADNLFPAEIQTDDGKIIIRPDKYAPPPSIT